MMKDYQRKTGKYILPGNLYMQTVYQIRDYHRLKEEADAILNESPPPPDGQPHGSSKKGEVERKAMRREKILQTVRVIDDAKEQIPEEYRKGVWENVMYRAAFPDDAHRNTYGLHKSRFIYTVARDLFLLE